MANAWGMAENNGVFNTGEFSKINSITWSVKPQVDESKLKLNTKMVGGKKSKN